MTLELVARGPQAKIPPQDLDAEAAVLSALLLEPQALDHVLEILRPEHFYSEANRRIYEVALELSEHGTPIDTVSVAGALRDKERLAQVGGSAYLAELVDAVPAVAHLPTYARRVKEKWRIRQLIGACQRLLAEAYGNIGDVQQFVDGAEQAIYEIARTPESTNVQKLEPIIRAVFEQITESASRGERITGIPTGFERVDSKTAGLHNGELTIIAGRPGMGKAQPIGAKVLTPSGWKRIGNLRVGDMVIGADGKPTRVTHVFERGRLPVFRLTLSDGGSTECCDEHLWLTRTRSDRRRGLAGTVKALRDIRASMARGADGGLNHSIPYVAPIEYEAQEVLLLDPYLLGVYLGDGCSCTSAVISNPEPDIQRAIACAVPDGDLAWTGTDGLTIRVRGRENGGSKMMRALDTLGLRRVYSEDKFIPGPYKRASVQDRVRLLQGLCDTDGFVVSAGKAIEYSTTSERLRDDIVELAAGLGGYVTWSEKLGSYRKDGEHHITRIAYRIILSFPRGDVLPVSSQKHLAKWNRAPHRLPERFVKSVEPAGEKVCRCIAVESPLHLYVTDDFIVTHNTSYVMNVVVNIAAPRVTEEWGARSERPGVGVAVFSLEMPREQLASRMVCSEARVDVGKMRQGHLQERDWEQLTQAATFLYRLPIWIDDTPAISVLELRAKVRRLQAEYNRTDDAGNAIQRVGLVVVDYLQLMSGSGNTSSREQEISEISRNLKQLSKELRVPVIALSQLNRAVETRGKDKRPQLSDLRESGAIEQDADNIIFVYREDYYDENSDQKGIAELIIAKQRNGPTGPVKVKFSAAYTRFDNLAPGEHDEAYEQ